jgi:signal transduction histidine kinase
MPDISDADIGDASRFLADRHAFGLVWVDASLVVQQRFGLLVDFVAIGRPLTESIIALIGFEDDIAARRRARDSEPLTIPNIIMNLGGEPDLRVSLDIHWAESQDRYLLLVRNVADDSAFESELRTQRRMRAIAEAEVVAKSEAIQRANQELALANRDLEEFAYVISHDLKAPLRALRYDLADADRDLAAGNLKTVHAKLVAMQDHQARMLAMLNGLFEYARAGRKTEGIAMVDTRQLVEEIASSLARPDGMEIAIDGSWPHIMTLIPPLSLVLRNLIDNAIKHHDRPNGRIALVGHIGDSTLDITVTDDGPGIPHEWQSAVFLPFRKIDEDRGGHESSGMGLALVRRTLDRVGGTIELHSDAPSQRGTRFIVGWPRRIVV